MKGIRQLFYLAAACISLVNKGWAQTKQRPVIVRTIDRGDYFYIPPSALVSTADGIVYQDKTLRKVPLANRPIELIWHSVCTDGSYLVTITPEQIFFSSGHDNPNPNALFWVIGIDRKCYEKIRNGLAQKLPKNFIVPSKDEPNQSGLFKDESSIIYVDKFQGLTSVLKNWSSAQFAAYCKAQVKQKLDNYFVLLNSYSSNSQNKLVYPITYSPKLFSDSEDEINDWLPVEIERK
ncbi:MAG: hypothetical protein ACRYFX_07665 [Janthinobacterium lividum]